MASENIKKQVTDASRKTAVCSRSVANFIYLTNYRSKNLKAIMHHTQGLEQHPPNETMSFPARAKVRK